MGVPRVGWCVFFFSSRRRHTRLQGDWSSDVCSSDLGKVEIHIDLTGLEIGDSIHIGQVTLPEGVTPANLDEDFTVATIVAPSAMKAEEEEAAPEGEVPTLEEGEEGEGGEAPAEGGAEG